MIKSYHSDENSSICYEFFIMGKVHQHAESFSQSWIFITIMKIQHADKIYNYDEKIIIMTIKTITMMKNDNHDNKKVITLMKAHHFQGNISQCEDISNMMKIHQNDKNSSTWG